MSWHKKLFYIFFRSWFFLMMGLPLIIFFPILIILTLRQSWYPAFFKAARLWASFTLHASGFMPKRMNGTLKERGKSFMIIANHTSILDILCMLHSVKNPFVFVAKAELSRTPIFGFFYRRTCILVDRGSSESKRKVFEHAKEKINLGISICIFPEGGVPDDERIILDTFKDGAFRLAIEHQLPIIPIVFPDNKKHFSYTFFSGSYGKIRTYILDPISTMGLSLNDKSLLRGKAHQLISTKLSEFNKHE